MMKRGEHRVTSGHPEEQSDEGSGPGGLLPPRSRSLASLGMTENQDLFRVNVTDACAQTIVPFI